VTIGEKLVASIATVIFMAGNKRMVCPDTQFMIHLPMGGLTNATADEMEAYAKETKRVETEIVSFYTKELGMNKESIFPLLRNETWLDNEQLIALGFVTSDNSVQLAAKVKKSTNKNRNKMSKKNKLATLLAKLIGEESVCKMIFSADEKEINFPDIPEDGVIEVGATATYDGQPAEGSIVGQDGKTYVFEAGVLTAINDPAEEEEITEEEMVEALAATLELMADISERLEKVEKEAVGLKTDNTELKSKLEKAEKTITALKGKSEPPKDDDKKDKNQKKGTLSELIAQRKLAKFNKN